MRFSAGALLVALAGVVAAEDDSCPSLTDPRVIKLSGDQASRQVTFTSDHYVGDIDCVWVIDNDVACDGIPVVELVIKSLETEYWFDTLDVYDSDENYVQGKQIDSLSGITNLEESVNSNTQQMFLHFQSDIDNFGYDGFELEFNPMCKPALPSSYDHCKPLTTPEVYTNQSGSIEFTTEKYLDHMECGWLIKNINNTCDDPRVHVDFERFGTELSHDYLTLYNQSIVDTEAHDIKSFLMARYSGPFVYNGPGSFRTEGPELFITFNSDEGISGDHFEGFTASYYMACGDIQHENCPAITDPRVYTPVSTHAPTTSPTAGEDSAPGDLNLNTLLGNFFDIFDDFLGGTPPGVDGMMTFHSDHYGNNQQCGWRISNTNSTCEFPIVKLKFPYFSTEKMYDTMSIYDGSSVDDVKLGTWSGSEDSDSPGAIQSTGPDIFITFKSDRGVTYDGFSVTYEFACGEAPGADDKVYQCPPWSQPRQLDYQDSLGEHHLDGYKLTLDRDTYEDNIECVWELRNNRYDCLTDGLVRLDFQSFATEMIHDHMTVYDGDAEWDVVDEKRKNGATQDELASLGSSYSGSRSWEVPHVILSNSDVLRVYFHADSSMSGIHGYEGFEAHVDFPCKNTVEANTTSTVPWDCDQDHLDPVLKVFYQGDLETPVLYNHHSLPFSVGYPHFIEHGFEGVHDSARIIHAKEPVVAEAMRAMDLKDGEQIGTSFCCTPLSNEDPKHNLTGKIAICDRGECVFATKARMVQAQGAVAMLLVDYDEAGVKMASNSPLPDVKILAGSVKKSFGDMLDSILAQNAQPILNLGPYICDKGTHNPTKAPTTKPTRPPPTPAGATKKPTSSPTSTLRTLAPTTNVFAEHVLKNEVPSCGHQRLIYNSMNDDEYCLDDARRAQCLYTCCEEPSVQEFGNMQSSQYWDSNPNNIHYECLVTYEAEQLKMHDGMTSVLLEVVVKSPDYEGMHHKEAQHELLNEIAEMSGVERTRFQVDEYHHARSEDMEGGGKKDEDDEGESEGGKVTKFYIFMSAKSLMEAEELRMTVIKAWDGGDLGRFKIENIREPVPVHPCENKIDTEECVDTALYYKFFGDTDDCKCKKKLTAFGVFILVIIPLGLILTTIGVMCVYLPACAFYKGSNKQNNNKSYKYAKAAEMADIRRASSQRLKVNRMSSDDFDGIDNMSAPDGGGLEGLQEGEEGGNGNGFDDLETGGTTTDNFDASNIHEGQGDFDDDDEEDDDDESTV